MITPDAVLGALARAEYRTSSYSTANGSCVMVGFASAEVVAALAGAEYRTSSYSTGNGACVMIGHAAGWVGIQDSKQVPRTTLPVTASQFAALIAAVSA
jgi:uncharacterized protein DUF397